MTDEQWHAERRARDERENHAADEVRQKLARLRQRNNPDNEPTGHFTGRCERCGSKDLWDDNMNYGCNCCSDI